MSREVSDGRTRGSRGFVRLPVETCVLRALTIFVAAETGHRDQERVLAARHTAQSSRHFVAIHSRHPDIQEHVGRQQQRRELEGCGPVMDHVDLVAIHAKQRGQALSRIDVVIDDENAVGFTRCPRMFEGVS